MCPSWDLQSLVHLHLRALSPATLQHLLDQLHLQLPHPPPQHHPSASSHWLWIHWIDPNFPCNFLSDIFKFSFVYLSFFAIISFLLAVIILVAASIYVTAIFMMLAYILTAIFPQREWLELAQSCACRKVKGIAHTTQT